MALSDGICFLSSYSELYTKTRYVGQGITCFQGIWKAALVGANTVKGAARPVSSPKAAPRAVSRVENRGSVASSSPVVGREAEPGGRVGVRGRTLGRALSVHGLL